MARNQSYVLIYDREDPSHYLAFDPLQNLKQIPRCSAHGRAPSSTNELLGLREGVPTSFRNKMVVQLPACL